MIQFTHLSDLIKLFTKMASGDFCPCRFSYQNLFLIDFVEEELARDPGQARGPYSGSISLALSCNLTPGPALVPALIPAPVPILVPIDKLFKQFIKAYLESNQRSSEPLAEHN